VALMFRLRKWRPKSKTRQGILLEAVTFWHSDHNFLDHVKL